MQQKGRSTSTYVRSGGIALLSTLVVAACDTPAPVEPAPHAPDAAASANALDSSATIAALPFSNRFAYVWADQLGAAIGAWYAPNAAYSYNAMGAPNLARRLGVGQYEVRLGAMAKAGIATRKETIIATAYDAGPRRCNVLNWGDLGADLVVRVACATDAGAATNARFTLLMVGAGSLLGRHGFAWANNPVAAAYAPPAWYAATTGPGPITISRVGVGSYNANLTLPRPVGGSTENYFVTTYGNTNNHCKIGSWAAVANVRCYSRLGGVPADNMYDVLLVNGGRPGRRLGFAWANSPAAALYVPDPFYSRNSSGGAISITRLGVGQYHADFAGLAKLAGHKEDVQVTAYGAGFVHCNVVSWGNVGAGMRINIACRNQVGALVDAQYTVLLIE